jgi:DNA-binding MarR family transcriptional regulator
MVKTKIEVVRELGKAMAELRIQFRQCIQGNLKIYDVGLTYEMIEVMSLLWQKDGINQQVIADRTLRDKSSMTYLIDNLVKRSLVKRIPDEEDRRNNLIFLTEEGKQLHSEVKPWSSVLFESSAAGLTVEDLQAGIAILNKMTENLKVK